MSVTDRKMDPNAKAAWHLIMVPIVAVASQTNLKALSMVPGFPFEVMRVQVYASGVTATIAVNVKIGAQSVLTAPITPVAGTDRVGTFMGGKPARRGTATDALNVEYTNDGTGTGVNLRASVWIRAYPGAGEA